MINSQALAEKMLQDNKITPMGKVLLIVYRLIKAEEERRKGVWGRIRHLATTLLGLLALGILIDLFIRTRDLVHDAGHVMYTALRHLSHPPAHWDAP
ncbi:hypothetical protein Sbs19_08510 [Sphingobium sp. BS19]|nr:hypothetical protein Sbs19_08510 [Sphingobium sp. BS19]